MPPENNAAPGQQNYPDENGNNGRETQSKEEIISGAQQEDQLDAMKEEAAKDPSENENGSTSDSTDYTDRDRLSQEDIKNGINTFEATNEPHAALETPEGKNNGAKPAAFNNQRSNHP